MKSAVCAIVEFDETNSRIIRSSIGVDVSAGASAPSEKVARIHVDFNGPPALYGYVVAKLAEVFEEGVVVAAGRDVGVDPAPF